jgi:hypothetical protein
MIDDITVCKTKRYIQSLHRRVVSPAISETSHQFIISSGNMTKPIPEHLRAGRHDETYSGHLPFFTRCLVQCKEEVAV